MKEKISNNVRAGIAEFQNLNDTNKIYFVSILLNHLVNGLINENNTLNSDEVFEQENLVLEPYDLELENPMTLATQLLLLASEKEDMVLNPNGKDIEIYIKSENKKAINPVIKTFYKLKYFEKIDFMLEIFYIVSEIKEIEMLDFDWNNLIYELLKYENNI